MKNPWPDLKYWDSGEYQLVQERLDDLDKLGVHEVNMYNPKRRDIFQALKKTKFEDVKVAIFGQDPYPDHEFATGVAFSIPPIIRPNAEMPLTLANIFTEYCKDLHYPYPLNGDLTKWCEQGVLLMNVIPTCAPGKPRSHEWLWTDTDSYCYLIKEIIEKLNDRGIIFVFLGAVAQEYSKFVKEPSQFIQFSHPSPRGNINSRNPFLGSRMFTKINDLLQGDKIDWCLNHVTGQMGVRADNSRDYVIQKEKF